MPSPSSSWPHSNLWSHSPKRRYSRTRRKSLPRKLSLTYCRITAPITGRVGLRLSDPGNIVHAADNTGLVVITQLQPVSVIFTIAEDQLPPVLQKMRAGLS